MRFRLVALLLLLLVMPVLGQQNSQPPVPDSPKGFDKQYQSVFKAYKKGKEQEWMRRFRTFSIPDHWFSDVFGPEQGPKLAIQYEELFQGFVNATTDEFRTVVAVDSARINTKVWKTEPEINSAPRPAPHSLVALPALQHFQIRYQSGPYVDYDYTYGTALAPTVISITRGHDNSWVESFIYVDGAFRFFGGGVYPFWDPCSRNGLLPGGHLVKGVEPIYPQAAKKKGLGGLVEMDITIAKDGSVKDATVFNVLGIVRSGLQENLVARKRVKDGLLAEAARQAVLQWRYEPFMYCGEPIEKRTRVAVRFPPP